VSQSAPIQQHLLFWHASEVPQTLPQLPQSEGSVTRLTQAPEQTAVSPVGQQIPLRQLPPSQTLPQPPQSLESVSVSAQAPLQFVSPLGQQIPLRHVSPPPQLPVSQVPSQPSDPPQTAPVQLGKQQAPLRQIAPDWHATHSPPSAPQ
jgi:hypothetical protein